MDEKQTPKNTTKKFEKINLHNERAQTFFRKEYKHENNKLPTGYTRATHASVMNKDLITECPFCAVKITVDHILWDCKETEIKRLQINITKEILKGGKKG
jgi:hypothetical protein